MRTTMTVTMAALGLSLALAKADEKIEVGQVPAAARDAVKAKFPMAEIVGAEKEIDGGKTVYELNLKLHGKKIDVSVGAAGEILAVEKEVAVADVPADVLAALHAKHVGATVKSAEEILKDGKLQYELIVATAAGKTVEVVIEARWVIAKEEEKKAGE